MTTRKNIPSEDEWGDYKSDRDSFEAYSAFAGKTIEEVQILFRKWIILTSENLRSMPPVPFRYYIFAYRDYVISSGMVGDCDAPDATSIFLDIIVYKLNGSPDSILPILSELMPSIEYIANNQNLFGADQEIYGIFLERLRYIKGFM